MDNKIGKLADWICVEDNWLSPEECQRFLDAFVKSSKLQMNDPWRKCQESFIIEQTPELHNLLKAKIKTVVNIYREKFNAGPVYSVTALEVPRIFKYSPSPDNSEHFSIHADNWSLDSASRQLSIIIYLNDVQEGGETEFPNLGMKVSPRKGRLLIFPSFYLFMHKGCAPVSEDKHIIVCWCHFGGEGHKYRVSPM